MYDVSCPISEKTMRSADQTLPGECIGIRLRVMMIGATGAVGQQAVATLRNHRAVEQLT